MSSLRKHSRLLVLVVLLVLLLPGEAHAYIGPGAGFAVAGSFFAVFAAVFSALLTFITWPLRLLKRTLFGWRSLRRSRFKRVVILGLDGMDHGLTETMLEEGKLPHLARLREKGCFKPLGTTVPPLSPVAWSTFQTGVNPGKHNIFDFLTPDLRTYCAKLSSVEIRPPRRSIRLGKYRIPLGKADLRLLRKSQPFWGILSKYGIFSCVQRVPITWPPEKLRGVLLSAMCVPDLRGTQGMFSYYTTRQRDEGEKIGGEVHHVTMSGGIVHADLVGPRNPMLDLGGDLRLPFTVTVKGPDRAVLKVARRVSSCGKTCTRTGFRLASRRRGRDGPRRVQVPAAGHGAGFRAVRDTDQHRSRAAGDAGELSVGVFRLSGEEARHYATLGLAEDTWALNEGVLNDDQFIQQCLDMDAEREAMFLDALEKVPARAGRVRF